MKTMAKFFLIFLMCIGLVVVSISPAMAQKWPDKPIEILGTYAPGGSTDNTTRLLATIWEELLGVKITFTIIDGASGQIGLATYLKDRKKEGYSLLAFGLSNLAYARKITPTKGIDFDYRNDLAYLGSMATDPGVLVSPKNKPYNTLEKFINAAKQKKLLMGLTRFAQVDTLVALQMAEQLGLQLQLVPHGGTNVFKPALAGGHVDVGIAKVSPMFSIKDTLNFIGTLYSAEYPKDSFAYSPVVNKVLGINVADVQNERCVAVHRSVIKDYPERYKILKETYDKARSDPRFIKAGVEKLGYFENMIGMVAEEKEILDYTHYVETLIDKYKNLIMENVKK